MLPKKRSTVRDVPASARSLEEQAEILTKVFRVQVLPEYLDPTNRELSNLFAEFDAGRKLNIDESRRLLGFKKYQLATVKKSAVSGRGVVDQNLDGLPKAIATRGLDKVDGKLQQVRGVSGAISKLEADVAQLIKAMRGAITEEVARERDAAAVGATGAADTKTDLNSAPGGSAGADATFGSGGSSVCTATGGSSAVSERGDFESATALPDSGGIVGGAGETASSGFATGPSDSGSAVPGEGASLQSVDAAPVSHAGGGTDNSAVTESAFGQSSESHSNHGGKLADQLKWMIEIFEEKGLDASFYSETLLNQLNDVLKVGFEKLQCPFGSGNRPDSLLLGDESSTSDVVCPIPGLPEELCSTDLLQETAVVFVDLDPSSIGSTSGIEAFVGDHHRGVIGGNSSAPAGVEA